MSVTPKRTGNDIATAARVSAGGSGAVAAGTADTVAVTAGTAGDIGAGAAGAGTADADGTNTTVAGAIFRDSSSFPTPTTERGSHTRLEPITRAGG